jgi:hypothetical protein
MITQKFQKQSWWWLLLTALLLVLLLPASAISAARFEDFPEEDLIALDETDALDEWLFDEYDSEEDLRLFLVLAETASAEMRHVIHALDQFQRGNEKNACQTLEHALFWTVGLYFAVWPPAYEYWEITEGIEVGALMAAEGLVPLYLMCNNGKEDRLTALEYGLAFRTLDKARDILHIKSAEAQAVAGMTVSAEPELLPELAMLGQELIGVLEPELYGDAFSIEIFRADVEIAIEALHYMAGWFDRYNAGETVYCLEYVYYYELLGPALFAGVPDVYRYWVDEHKSAIDLVKDTSRPLVEFCLSLMDNPAGPVSQFTVDQARHGLSQALVRVNRVMENIR